MKRNAIKYLYQWKASNDRKPLIMLGARQVGKTWLMQEFAKTLETVYPLEALKMAYKSIDEETAKGLIHHSDRGSQYCSQNYAAFWIILRL